MSETKTLEDLYIHEIKDIHSANKQAAEAAGMFARKVDNSALTDKLEQAVEQIKANNEALDKLAERHDKSAGGMHCKGMEGLVTEGKKHVLHSDYADESLREASAIAQFQRMTHYALSGYGTANAYAKRIGDMEGSKTLLELLDISYEGDRAFSALAEDCINRQAAQA